MAAQCWRVSNDVDYWPKADIASAVADVCSWGKADPVRSPAGIAVLTRCGLGRSQIQSIKAISALPEKLALPIRYPH
jgi:hypothetical protein